MQCRNSNPRRLDRETIAMTTDSSGQSYKCSTIVNYDLSFILTRRLQLNLQDWSQPACHFLPGPDDEVHPVTHLWLHEVEHGGDEVGGRVALVVAEAAVGPNERRVFGVMPTIWKWISWKVNEQLWRILMQKLILYSVAVWPNGLTFFSICPFTIMSIFPVDF